MIFVSHFLFDKWHPSGNTNSKLFLNVVSVAFLKQSLSYFCCYFCKLLTRIFLCFFFFRKSRNFRDWRFCGFFPVKKYNERCLDLTDYPRANGIVIFSNYISKTILAIFLKFYLALIWSFAKSYIKTMLNYLVAMFRKTFLLKMCMFCWNNIFCYF